MIDKIIEFLDLYLNNVEENIKTNGEFLTISAGLNILIKNQIFNNEELRKKCSLYIKRIISEKEFKQLLNYEKIEYCHVLYEQARL